MKRLLLTSAFSLFLVACTSGGGSDISETSSRTPKGSDNALVNITEYADLQCPACRNAHASIVAPILEKYGNVVQYEFKHFPLRSIHRFALDAAQASECAADQGKFWEYIDLAFEKQEELSHDALTVWAGELNLDTTLFERCWKSGKKRDIVLNDYKEGREKDVAGTPSFFVNGERVQTGFDTLSAAIEEVVGSMEQRL